MSLPAKTRGRPKKPIGFTNTQKIDELFRRGVLAPWLLHETQKKMYHGFHHAPAKKFIINSSRRLGKSFLLCVIALEQAIQKPASQIRFMCPTQRMVRKIMIPTFRQILTNCPVSLRPKFNKFDGVWTFPNGSEIHICGSEQGQVDGLRGTSANLIIIDEAGFCSDLEYALESVLMPQTLTIPDARIILASTPPPSPDHPFLRYVNTAIEQESYSKFTIYDNPMLTRTQIDKYMIEAGGEMSTTWRREYLAEFVTDKDLAVLPEATADLMQEIVVDLARPQFYEPFSAIDLGYIDNTGILFGYYDFLKGKVIIDDEILINKITSRQIADLTKERELQLWNRHPKARVIDGNPMQIADLNEIHNFSCYAPSKQDLHANINRVRLDLTERRLIINPRCTKLVEQIKYATWDSTKTKFSRSSANGHWDLLAALIYFLKAIDRVTIPYPASHGYDQFNDWGFPRKHPNQNFEHLLVMFPTSKS